MPGVTGRPEGGFGGMRSWMQAQRVPAASTHIAAFIDLFRSRSKPGTGSSTPTNSSKVHRALGNRRCARDVRYLGAIEASPRKNLLNGVENAGFFGFNARP